MNVRTQTLNRGPLQGDANVRQREGGALRVRGLRKRYGETQALAGVNFEVDADELVVVLGPTGAGKTTLLRCLAGLDIPEEGSVHWGRDAITGLPPAERDIALVFQNFSLYPRWSVRRNLEFPLRAPGRRLNASEIAERIEWAAEVLRIGPLLDRPAARLSGGEMQRVAIGRAIVRRPRIFLMDEPLTNLDAKLREALRVELVCLRRELGIPMLYVTHDQTEAMSMGDRLVVLSEGRVLQAGTPETVYRKPASAAVARQLGQPPINLFRAERHGDWWCSLNGTPLAPAPAQAPNRMLLGVRPEDVSPNGGRVEGIVKVVEERGADRVLLCEWAGQQVHILTNRSSVHVVGATVRPAINAERLALWPEAASDRQSTRSLKVLSTARIQAPREGSSLGEAGDTDH